jgi:hypothetical protein
MSGPAAEKLRPCNTLPARRVKYFKTRFINSSAGGFALEHHQQLQPHGVFEPEGVLEPRDGQAIPAARIHLQGSVSVRTSRTARRHARAGARASCSLVQP